MSCGKCPEFKEQFKEFKEKKQQETVPEPEPAAPEPVKEKSWWEKFKDRIDPAGIGGLPQPSMGF